MFDWRWWINVVEPAKQEDWLKEKLPSFKGKNEEIIDNISEEGSIEQMIWDIDNAKIRHSLECRLKEKRNSPEEIKREIALYYDNIENSWDESLKRDVDDFLSKNSGLLPSRLLIELESRETIREIISLMDKSSQHILPSIILKYIDTYVKFAKVKAPDKKKIIYRYIDEWYPPKSVDEEYESYIIMRDYKYKNDNVKNLVLSFIERWERPTILIFYFDLFKDSANAWEAETKIEECINQF